LWPVPGAKLPTAALLQWGYQRSPAHTHNGLDIPAPEGTPVLAAGPGVVTHASAQWQPGFSGYGAHVVVQSGAEWHLYAHLSGVAVEPGDTVEAGQRLGSVGRTAFTANDHSALLKSGSHLHFERSGRPYPQPSSVARLDPLPLLRGEAMYRLTDLADAWNRLRAAALTRAGKPLPGVSQAAADQVAAGQEEFLEWAATAPPLIDADTWDGWERRYAQLRALLPANGPAASLPKLDPDATPITDALRAGGSFAWGLAALAAILILRKR
jgi:hypothetical protein